MTSPTVDLSALPVLDGHLHAPLREIPSDLDGYRWLWYEGQREDASLAAGLTAYRWAVHELAAELGCGDDEESVIAAIATHEVVEWARRIVGAADVEALVVDTGFPPPELALLPDELGAAAGVPVATLLRIEQVAGELTGLVASFDQFLDAFDERVEGARAAGHAGLKSIIAYRSGLAVEPASLEEARAGFEREHGRGATRLVEKPLLDFLLVRSLGAARRQGTADAAARRLRRPGHRPAPRQPAGAALAARERRGERGAARPAPRRLSVRARGAWLAAVYPHVYLDVATCIPPLGFAALVDTWREALAIAPISRLQASSDAAGLAEHVWLGARRARATLGAALGELHAAGALTAAEAEDAAEAILAGNARGLYLG